MQEGEHMINKLNNDQRTVVDKILAIVNNNDSVKSRYFLLMDLRTQERLSYIQH